MRTRGAANDAFEALFALPFGQRVVEKFRFDPSFRQDEALAEKDPGGSHVRSYAGATLISVGVLGAAAGIYSLESARALGAGLARDNASQQDAVETNKKIQLRNVLGVIGIGAGSTAAAAGLLLLDRYLAGFTGAGGTMIVVTHQLDKGLAACDRAVALRDGRIAFDGPSPAFRSSPEAATVGDWG